MYYFNHSSWEVQAGGLGVQYPLLQDSKFDMSLLQGTLFEKAKLTKVPLESDVPEELYSFPWTCILVMVHAFFCYVWLL